MNFYRVSTTKISEVRVYLTDTLLRRVALNGVPMTIKLVIRYIYNQPAKRIVYNFTLQHKRWEVNVKNS